MTDRHPRILQKIGENAWAVWPSTEPEPPQVRRAYRKAQKRALEIGREFAAQVAERQRERDERCA